MPVSTTTYKGLTVITGTPTGEGGQLVQDNFKELADRIGPCHFATTTPSPANDGVDTAGLGKEFEVGSRWIYNSSERYAEYICVDNTTASAVWISAYIIKPPFFLTDGPTISTDASFSNLFRVTLGGNRTMANPTNGYDGQIIEYEITQDGTGGRTITWQSDFLFSGGVAPTLTTTPDKTDIIAFRYRNTDSKWISRGGQLNI
jgi:hypothetical protein